MTIKDVAQRALPHALALLTEWLPSGKLNGREYKVGDIHGAPGESLSINIDTGKWADFAAGIKGGDLVSLYAAINGTSQKDAAREVLRRIGAVETNEQPRELQRPQPTKPPTGVKPNFKHHEMGEPTNVWTYHTSEGEPLFYVARYDHGDKKEFRPFTYTDKWTSKGWPTPRPLYNQHLIRERIIIVEGEKAADALQSICPDKYSVVTWPNGAQAYDKADWRPVYGKHVIIWPDHDEPGRIAAAKIAAHLLMQCPEVKILNTKDDAYPDGWDAADANFTWPEFIKWAKPRAVLVNNPKPQPTYSEPPMPSAQDAPPNQTNILIAGDEAIEEMTTKLSPNVAANVQRCGLQVSGQGRPTENILNVSRILTADFTGRFWFDEFQRSFMTDINGDPEPLHDTHVTDMQTLIQASYGLRKISKASITDGITYLSYRDRRNSAKSYFLSLKWDGLPRMEDFFGNACGADDSAVNRAISRYFFVSIMARLFGPELDPIYGNKVDSMLVLEGDQGLAKGMLLKVLIGRGWHFEVSKGSKDKDFFQDMRGKLIGEVAELAAFDGQNLDSIKRVISCQTDRLRVSYGKESEDFDRTCILVGTTNKDEYLTDDTGNRRFLPIKIKRVDLEYTVRNREQVFAEALQYYRENVKDWWSIPRTDIQAEHAKRMVKSEWQDDIERHLIGYSEAKIAEIWVNGLRQELAKLSKAQEMEIARALKNLGWAKDVRWDAEKKRAAKVWVKAARH